MLLRSLSALVASTCVLAVAGCASSRPVHHTSAASPAFSVDPLTGEGPLSHPVVAVKIDDTASGRPQLGIDAADIVYVEAAEGGLTRLLAVFHTTLPRVESVRSTRTSDPELALQYGPIAYVASGGAAAALSALDHSGLRADIADRGGPGFTRDARRPAPYNLVADLGAVAAQLAGGPAKDIGLTWSASPSNTSSQPGTEVKTVVGATPVTFRWDAGAGRYERVIDGSVQRAADGRTIETPNVVVQFCSVTTAADDTDVAGHPAQYTHTVGSGRVAVFRDGHRIDGTWRRAGTSDGTHLLDSSGKAISLAPGGAWFILVATGASLG